jgi:hypothetical protein
VDEVTSGYTSAQMAAKRFLRVRSRNNLGGLLVADSTALLVAMQYIEEKFKSPENRRANFCQYEFFSMRQTAHLLQCKASKHAALLHGFYRSLRFSTLFFTELLKRCRNYWKQICPASH